MKLTKKLREARRRGGLAGGPARARVLSPEQRSEIARHGVRVREARKLLRRTLTAADGK